jgi:hypothetical protein
MCRRFPFGEVMVTSIFVSLKQLKLQEDLHRSHPVGVTSPSSQYFLRRQSDFIGVLQKNVHSAILRHSM